MKTWAEVEKSEQYQALSPAQKKAAKRKYPHVQANIQGVLSEIGKTNDELVTKVVKAVETLNDALAQLDLSKANDRTVAKGIDETLMGMTVSLGARLDSVEQALSKDDETPRAILSLVKKVDEISFKQPDLSGVDEFVKTAGSTMETIERKARQLKKVEPPKHKWKATVVDRVGDRIKSVIIEPVKG